MTILAIGAVLLLAIAGLVLLLRRARAELRYLDPRDVETAQRVLESEVGSAPVQIQRAVLWCVRNLARDEGLSLYSSATRGHGYGPVGALRPYATDQDPSGAARTARLSIIREVLTAFQIEDPTSGANDWFQPVEQDEFVARGLPGYTRSAAQVVEDELRDGAIDLGIVGTGRDQVRMFRKRVSRAAAA